MKIEIQGSTGGTPNPFTVCVGGIQSPLEGARMAFPFEKQISKPSRAAGIQIFDRNLREFHYDFQIIYDFASIAAAEAWQLGLGKIPKFGKITFTTEAPGTVFTLDPGFLTVIDPGQMGRAITVTWNIHGGQLK